MRKVTESLFKAPDIEGTADQLAAHMPQGKVWQAKNVDGTNMRGLVAGMARPFNIIQQQVELLAREFDINQTVLLIDEWEESVGLPDDCFGGTGNSLEERRAAVIERLRRSPIVTLAEFQALIDRLFPGAGIKLKRGAEHYTFEYEFPIPLFGNANEKFVLVAQIPAQEPFFEYDFEILFTGGFDSERLRCILNKIMPSNVILEIEEIAANA